MPGNILRYECDCGLEGDGYPGGDEVTSRVVAYDPLTQNITTCSRKEIEGSNLVAISDPYCNPLMFTVEKMKSLYVLQCPKCRNVSLKCYLCGNWD